MSPESKQFLRYVARAPKGRVGYGLLSRELAVAVAEEALDAGYVRERRFGFDPGFQITPEGRAYLAGGAE